MTISTTAYAELHVATNFSFLRGASHARELMQAAAVLGYRAIGVADRNTLAGIVRAHAAAKDCGVRLVVGARLDLCRDLAAPEEGSGPSYLVFPTDRAAYARLSQLLTLGKRRAPKGSCWLTEADLVAHAEGQILVALPPDAPDGNMAGFADGLAAFARAAPSPCYLAAQHLYRGDDALRITRLASLAETCGTPLVATNDVHAHDPARRALQDVLTCIREHCTIDEAGFRLFANAERHLKRPDEMARLFRRWPEAVARTVEIAEACRFSLDELAYEYPVELVPNGGTPQDELARLAWVGAETRYPQGVPDQVRRQIAHELTLIGKLRFAPYFLTVHDIVRFARSRGILCQGRGSAANSAVCYCLGITAVDPGRIDLLFERFVSAARDEPPDIDVDFEHERREEVIQYIYERYGRQRAGIAATVISYRARSAIREVGKALGLSVDVVGALASTIWGWSSEGVEERAVREAGLDPRDRRLCLALDLARTLIGFPRHLSQHVGGFVITRRALSEVVPIMNAAMDERTNIEWDKDDLDALGILKIDVLGLGMLTCIRKAFDLLAAHHGSALSLATVPAEDPAVYDMLCAADSVGVFQVESRAQMSMLPRLKPRNYYDLVIEVAIVRPGPIQGDMVHPYLRRRNGEEAVSFPSAELERVLGKTLGVPLFQEQAMHIAMVAAGFTAEEADALRRAMATFRRSGLIHTFREKLIGGMVERGYEAAFAERCFSQIEGFGDYGFPESHAASFALLVYVSAWLKCHYPAVFAAAILNSQPMGFYAPAQLVRDAREHGVTVRPIDVNASAWDNTLEPIGFSLTAADNQWAAVATGNQQAAVATGNQQAAVATGNQQAAVAAMDNPTHHLPSSSGLTRGSISPPHRCLPADAPCADLDGPDLAQAWILGSSPRMTEGGGIPGSSPTEDGMSSAVGGRGFALRLGFREIKGFKEEEAARLVGLRGAGYASVTDMWHRAGVEKATIERLARADGFGSIGLSRREALWAVRALGEKPLPLFAAANAVPAHGDPRATSRGEGMHAASREPDVALPAMPLGAHIVDDYAAFRLSLRAHPLALLRDSLAADKVSQSVRLQEMAQDTWVTVAGLVLVRQRPGSAKGVIFATLEDETGIANIIVWPPVFERYRRVVMGARLLAATGRVQKEGIVIHIVARRLVDLSHRLDRLGTLGDEAEVPLARADEVLRPGSDRRGTVRIKSRDFH